MQPLRRTHDRVESTPGFRCYCCHDTGIVVRTDMIYTDMQPTDIAAICKRCNAAASELGATASQLDGRLTKEQCEAIHTAEFEGWMATLKQRRSVAINFGAIAKPMPSQKPLNPSPEKPRYVDA